jgi:hypothetical protein
MGCFVTCLLGNKHSTHQRRQPRQPRQPRHSLSSELIEFAAFIKLRRTRPEMTRGYRIPVNNGKGVVLFFAPVSGLSYSYCAGYTRNILC